jgi:hypothetical protein
VQNATQTTAVTSQVVFCETCSDSDDFYLD